MTTIELTEKGMRQLAAAFGEELKKETVKNVDRAGLVDEGDMKRGYKVIEGDGKAHAHLVNTEKSADFHERGTGIYDSRPGASRAKIVPKKALGLMWKVRDKDVGKYKGKDGKVLKAGDYFGPVKSVRGVPASAMIRKALMFFRYK